MNKFVEQTLSWLQSVAPKLLGALVVLLIGWWLSAFLSNIIKKGMQRAKVDAGIISFSHSILKTLFRIVVIISVVAQLGVNVASLIAAVGAAGVTAGLALKDSLSNVASGVIIILNKTFRVGDYLEFEDVQGTVSNIEMMFTTLTTYDNKTIIIPNSKLTLNNLINYTAQKTRRLDLNYSISYDEDITKVKNLLRDIVSSNDKVMNEPEPVIAVSEHKESSINIVVKVWCSVEDYWSLYYYMQEKVKIMFDEKGIAIPFNQVDVHMRNV